MPTVKSGTNYKNKNMIVTGGLYIKPKKLIIVVFYMWYINAHFQKNGTVSINELLKL